MYAKVVVDVKSSNVDVMFTYRIPRELEDYCFVGSRVYVEFGVRNIMGYVLEITNECDYDGNVKEILDVLDFSKEINSSFNSLISFGSKYFLLTQAPTSSIKSITESGMSLSVTYLLHNEILKSTISSEIFIE